jgi:hypothetical protein
MGKQWQDRCDRFGQGKPAGTFAGTFQGVWDDAGQRWAETS